MFKTLKRVAAACLVAGVATGAPAQELNFFTIGTGGTSFTYYPVGGVIANAISNPPGSRECDAGGSCGVPGLIASAVSSRGSVDNINAILSGLRSSGFAQSDVAFWAYTGTGTREGEEPAENLRSIAALFPEHIHLVTLEGSGIEGVGDLAGLRVSIDEPGSGTRVDATLILDAFGLSVDDIEAEDIKGAEAADALRNGRLDAMFVVAGYPSGALVELAASADMRLVPIVGPEVDALIEANGFFAADEIPDGAYEGVPAAQTVTVGAQWFTGADQDEELIYNITAALWNDNTRRLLDVGHARGASITLDTALDGLGVPLHPGAERFYREQGMIE
ncbi:MAG: TAXI family TRAP transporter solute-binding subunit [Pseudomonadota bacterium]